MSGNRLFIKANKREDFSIHLRLMVDTLVYKLAVKYVSRTDERYIDILENTFENYNISVEEFKIEVFNRLK